MSVVRASATGLLSALFLLLQSSITLARETVCENPDRVQTYKGPLHWILVKETHVAIDKTQPVRVRQLRSREVTGCSGAGNDLYALRVLIDQGGPSLYHRDFGATTPDFWLGRQFALREMMGESAPQVIFDSGISGASDELAHQHIVPLTGPRKFTDVGVPEFDASWRETIGWFRSATGPIVVKAVPTIGDPDSDPVGFCHGCPHPYHYRMFRWQKGSATWELVSEIEGSHRFDGSVDPLVSDSEYIRGRLP